MQPTADIGISIFTLRCSSSFMHPASKGAHSLNKIMTSSETRKSDLAVCKRLEKQTPLLRGRGRRFFSSQREDENLTPLLCVCVFFARLHLHALSRCVRLHFFQDRHILRQKPTTRSGRKSGTKSNIQKSAEEMHLLRKETETRPNPSAWWVASRKDV